MDGDQDGAQAQGEERTRQQGDPQAEDEQQGQKAPEQVDAPDDRETRAALAERGPRSQRQSRPWSRPRCCPNRSRS